MYAPYIFVYAYIKLNNGILIQYLDWIYLIKLVIIPRNIRQISEVYTIKHRRKRYS